MMSFRLIFAPLFHYIPFFILVNTSCTLRFCTQALCFIQNITWDNHIDQLISRFNSAC